MLQAVEAEGKDPNEAIFEVVEPSSVKKTPGSTKKVARSE